ncbi:MAG: hypothetical protein ABUL55_01635 [Pseudomonadota bacterium]
MRQALAAAFAFVTLATPTISAADAPGWTYAYDNGVATATQRDDRGKVIATMTCRPPDGDIIFSDYTLARFARRANSAAIGVGNLTVTIPASVQRAGRDQVLTIHLPQRPPILAGVQPTDHITVTVAGHSQTYGDGSGVQMKDLAYACWGS